MSSAFRLLGKDLVAYGVMGALARSVHLLLLPILTRRFSPAEYGQVEIVATMTSLLAILMAFSLESAVAREWFERSRDGQREQFVSTIIGFIVVSGFAFFVLVWFQSTYISNLLLGNDGLEAYVILGALAAVLTAISGIPQIILRMERQIGSYTLMNLIQTIAFVTLAMLLIFLFDMGLKAVFLSQVIATLISLAFGLWSISQWMRVCFSIHHLRSALRFSLPLLPAVTTTWLNSQVDRILLATFLGLDAVGVVGAASRVALIIGLAVNVFQQAWTPLAISQIDQIAGRQDFYRRALNYYTAVMLLAGLVFVAFARELLAVLVPAQYGAGYVVIPWLVGAAILNGSGCITNLGTLISKRTFGNSIAAGAGVVINIGLSMLLIPVVGIWGAAIGSFLAALTFTSLQCAFSAHTTEVRFDITKLIAMLGCYVGTCIAILVVCEYEVDWQRSLMLRSLLLIASVACVCWLAYERQCSIELSEQVEQSCSSLPSQRS